MYGIFFVGLLKQNRSPASAILAGNLGGGGRRDRTCGSKFLALSPG
jgi:hypothetical protein